jgi:chemotaxis response regulator CheB
VKVLIVEDDPVWAIALRDQVIAAGHDVCGWATRAEDAADLAAEQRPDLIIVDAVLDSFVSGAEAVRAILHEGPVHVAFVSCDDAIAHEVLWGLKPLAIIGAPPEQAQVTSLMERASAAGAAGFTSGKASDTPR